MIFKEADDRSKDISELRRLKETSPSSYGRAIQQQIDNIYAGVAGERDAAHFLKREFVHSENIAVLHDLRIGVDGDYAQIDHLVLHRVRGAAWVLETKNYSGRLSCDEHGDWTVWRNGKPRSVPSPINQARRHCEALRLWLNANEIAAIYEIDPVVLISPTSSVDRTKLPRDVHVVKSDNFGPWWQKQADAIGVVSALGMAGRHLLSGMSPDEFVALGNRLADAHVPTSYDWRAILRLPRQKEATSHSDAQSEGHEDQDVVSERSGGRAPQHISTPHGEIRIARIPDGRFALRNEKNEALIEIVKHACRGKGQWNPRFRNWLISEDELPAVLRAIQLDLKSSSRRQE